MLHRPVNAISDGHIWPDSPTLPGPASPRAGRSSEPDPLGVFAQIIGGLSEQAALIGEDWTILAVNEAWAQTVTLNGLSDFRPGADYYREIGKLAQTGNPPARAVLRALDEIKQGQRTSFRLVYEGGGVQAGRQFEARLNVIAFGGRSYLMVTRYDITERTELRSLRDEFKLALLKSQEDERRRMGRELHDSGLQMLACLSLALARLKRATAPAEREAGTAEMEDLLLMARREFRAISYLAHPPQLESLSLSEALGLLIEGFGQRSGLEARLEVDSRLDALDHSAEHAVYRVVQEAISNVHRHAGARKLAVRVVARDTLLHVAVSDDGRGIPEGVSYGVGLEGMHARLRELGGRLTIFRRPPGTTVIASLPLGGRARESAPPGALRQA
jgi:signal transduction histidine kinase